MSFNNRWVGRVFKCTETGCVKVLTPDIVKPRSFIPVGSESFIDLGDGFYSRRSTSLVEVKGLEKAKVLAQHAHQGQKYGVHDYFEYHVLGVMMMLDSTANEDVSCVVILHDSIEDTWITEEVIRNQFNDQVADAVVALTKESGYDYEDYVNRIKSNPVALLVKTVDAKFNLAESEKEGDKRRIRKYNKLLNDLGGVRGEV